MDSIEEAVNWSAVARRAFELKLHELAVRQKRERPAPVPTSPAPIGDERYDEGFSRGQYWASTGARAEELDALVDFRDGLVSIGCWDDYFLPADGTPPADRATSLAQAVLSQAGSGDVGVSAFWQRVLGDEWPGQVSDPEFLRGFADGAASRKR